MLLVHGATGFTGQLVCKYLQLKETQFVVCGRNREKLQALASLYGAEVRLARTDKPRTLRRAFEQVACVISCVGPFALYGEPVVEACAAVGTHYVDTTGEQSFVKKLYDDYSDKARQAKIVVAPSTAFDVALTDIMSRELLQGKGDGWQVRAVYDLPGFQASRGTRKSALLMLRGPWWRYEEGGWQMSTPRVETAKVAFASGRALPAVRIPGAEIVTIPQHSKVKAIEVMLALDGFSVPVARLLPLLRHLPDWGLGLIERLIDRSAPGPRPQGRRRQPFLVRVEASRAGESHWMEIKGQDPYGLTAVIAAEAARRTVKAKPGVHPPSALLSMEDLSTLLYTASARTTRCPCT